MKKLHETVSYKYESAEEQDKHIKEMEKFGWKLYDYSIYGHITYIK